ncbi:hypothetical protein K9M74_02605 [Candidatus Woesearchaeota archaeon]|nr:hypothetical protein [Candidatus Woesearchaeota archaeon]
MVKVQKYEKTPNKTPENAVCYQNELFLIKWALEVCNQEYNGNLRCFLTNFANPTQETGIKEGCGGGLL